MKQPDGKVSSPKDELDLQNFLEIVWKAAAVLSAAYYLLGFIVVNIYLSRFGYYAVSLLNSQYLMAGVWASIPVTLGWVIVLYALKEPAQRYGSTIILVGLIVLIFILVAIGGLFLLMPFSEWIVGLPLGLRWLILIVMGFFTSLPLVAFFWWLSPLSSLSRQWIPLTVVMAFIAGLFILLYIITFSRSLYGEIPATLGGGKPRLVRIVAKNEARSDLVAAGINFSQGLATSEQLNLLVATEKEYIFLTKTGDSSFSVRSDIVQAVLYEKQ